MRMNRRPKIVFIGSGNLATQLSQALQSAGYSIIQVYSRTEDSAKTLANKLNCSFTTNPETISALADLYICALKDSVIQDVLNRTKNIVKDKILVHTAGSIPMNILAEYTTQYGVFYPMQTFSKEKEVDFSKVSFLLEGSNIEVSDLLENIAKNLSKMIYNLSSEDRKKVHLAAVFASNFANHSYALGAELVQSAGLPFEVLLPLIDETCEKVHSLPPIKAQSGPAVRNDLNVMKMQLEMLNDQPTIQKVYRIMSESIHILNEKNNKNVY